LIGEYYGDERKLGKSRRLDRPLRF